MGRSERGRPPRRHGEGLGVEYTSHRGTAGAAAVGLDVGLVPRDAERFAGLLDDKQVKPALAGMPVTVTTIVSLSDPVVMVACPAALGKHAAMPVAGTSLNENDEVTAGVVEPAAVLTPAAATTATASTAARVANVPGASASRRRTREWVRFMPVPPVCARWPHEPPGMKKCLGAMPSGRPVEASVSPLRRARTAASGLKCLP
jgi:hypothetical protein